MSQEEVDSGPVAPTSWLWKAPDTDGLVYRATNLPYSPGTGGSWDVGPPVLKTGQLPSLLAAQEAPEGRGHPGGWRHLCLWPASRSPHAMPSPERPAPSGGLPSPARGVITGEGERMDKELQIREKHLRFLRVPPCMESNPRSRCLPKATLMGLLSSTGSQGGESLWGLPMDGSTLRGPGCRPQGAWVPQNPPWSAPRGGRHGGLLPGLSQWEDQC